MNAVALSSMTQALPEIVLAVGAMALLMLGAYRERSDSVVSAVLDPAVDRGGGDRRRHPERHDLRRRASSSTTLPAS